MGIKKWGVIYGRNQEEIHGRSAHGSAPDQGKDAIVADEVELVGTTRAFDKAFRKSLPRVGKVASKASRIGFWRDEKEEGR